MVLLLRIMKRLTVNRHTKKQLLTMWWTGALLCVGLTACSSDSTIREEDEDDGSVPMQFGQAEMSASVTRSSSASSYLTQGFLVSSWKRFGSNNQQVVMDMYEVKYTTNLWSNLSKWDYVGTTSDGFYQTQIERYWDNSAFPYRFYAISPCPAADEIGEFTLDDTELTIPTTVTYAYQTCNNGVLTAGAEPYLPAQVACPDGSNVKDVDLLNNTVISKSSGQNGATTAYDRYVAMPFHHLTSKVRFAFCNSCDKQTPADFYLYNVKVKVVSDNFITEGIGYTADLANGDMLHGSFTGTATATTADGKLLLQTDDTRQGDLNQATDRENAYFCECADGMLQIPQTGVKLTVSFDVYGLEYTSDIISEDGHIVYEKDAKIMHYKDIAIEDEENNIDSFDWESNYIYTYILKVTDFCPLSISLSAELTPWTDVYVTIETNLEN